LKPGGTISAEARAKYLRVVDLIEHQVLPQVKSDALKVTGYALDAFSRWQLGDNMAAIEAANQGKKLCAGAATNPRDCAMLQMAGGLVVASQAYEKYKNAPTMSREEVKDFAYRMEAALNEIDRVNSWGRGSPAPGAQPPRSQAYLCHHAPDGPLLPRLCAKAVGA
jgi:hypothetical protein